MATKITKKPAAPSNLAIDRRTSSGIIDVSWKAAAKTGSARATSQSVKFYYHNYNDASGTWHLAKTYTPGLSTTKQPHTFSSLVASSSAITQIRADVTFKNSKGSSTSRVYMTFAPVNSPVIQTEVAGGFLRASITFPNDTDTQPLGGGSKSAAAKWTIKKQVQGDTGFTTVQSRAYRDTALAADRAMSDIPNAVLSPEKPTKYEISATVDGVVMFYDKTLAKYVTDKTVTVTRYVSEPNPPKVSKVTNEGHSYTVEWTYDNAGGFRPADSYELFYADVEQGVSASAVPSWTSIEKDLTAKAYTFTIDGEIPDGMKRCFMVKAYHYGIESDYVPDSQNELWGRPDPPSSVSYASGVVTASVDGTNYCPTASISIYREQAGNSVLVKSQKLSGGSTINASDTPEAGDAYRYYAVITNDGYGGGVSARTYSSALMTPNETHFTAWAKDDGCETAYLYWKDPDPDGTVSGYEVAWGETEDAFQSNKQPSTLKLEGRNVTRCRISELEPGKEYWFWIRTVGVADGTEFYSGWNNENVAHAQAHLVMANAPDEPGVVLSSNFVIAGGDSLTIGWSYTALGDAPQTSWNVVIAGDDFEAKYSSDDDGRTSADDSVTIDTTEFPSGAMTATVYVSNVVGTNSTAVPFTVAIIPSVSLAIESDVDVEPETNEDGETVPTKPVITAQPVGVTVTGGEENPDGTRYAVEFFNYGGIVQQLPNGEHVQYDGSRIGSFVVEPGNSTIRPELINGGKYIARAVAIDPETGLTGESEPVDFSVDWARTAEPPELTIESGIDDATITSESWPETDVLSVWRVTKDGVTLAVDEFEPGEAYHDGYAPFGGAYYRASIETPDGDVAFSDWEVLATALEIRIDYGGNSASLAYDITSGDTRDSGDEVKIFLDGSKSAITKRGTSRTHNITAVLIRGEDDDAIESVYALSRYDGACFVRTPDGMAYPASVNVGIDQDARSKLVNVSITCTEIDDDGLFPADKVGEE